MIILTPVLQRSVFAMTLFTLSTPGGWLWRNNASWADTIVFYSQQMKCLPCLCYSHSVLPTVSCFQNLPSGCPRFIATQGPLNQTEADFWNMVVQQKVEVSFTDLLLRIYSSVCSVFYVDVFLAFVGIFIEKILIFIKF